MDNTVLTEKIRDQLIIAGVSTAVTVGLGYWIKKRRARRTATSTPSDFTNWNGGNSVLSHLPNGIRNNNPGNLISTNVAWKGKLPSSGRFEVFKAPVWGVRALIKDLVNDIQKGKNTVTQLIHEFAPPHENNTQAYINHVSKALNINKGTPIQATKDNIRTLVFAIDKMENGNHYINASLFEQAYKII
ncbi:hypothetical protein [Persicobacter psychrovividus]|uniref:Structural protein P5 n=1 Tax=Persicobacter psychrovividus TaxID=387638 RepID=A0ABM7VNB5_9BACT|nr:hypothetical protein PEPS_47440 [Persicobacter psychrovividus]